MKSQPLAYNKDNQEDKEPLFDSVDTLLSCLRAFADMTPHIRPRKDVMRQAALKGFATATDLADYLVKKGVPFRDAHEIVGRTVAWCESNQYDLPDVPLAELRKFSALIGEDVFALLSPEGSMAARNHIGGTAPAQVRQAIERARERLGKN
jgi:argininosuccinate lyase